MADDLEVLFRKARPVDDPVGRYPGFQPGATTLEAGTIVKPGALALPCDILFERDVAIPLRDSTTIYADVFRPVGGKDLPVVIAWSPYGKQGGFESLDHMPLRAGVPQAAVSELQKFEGPDPAYWCAYGYAVANVDVRGAFMSEGDVHFWGSQDARDGYDAIEWLAAREWCNGRVGMAGNSWLAMAQWFIAAERPPHLAAIAPWEGLIDIYRYDVCRGGIPDTGFMERTIDGTCGNGRVEDPPPVLRRHPLMNESGGTRRLGWETSRSQPMSWRVGPISSIATERFRVSKVWGRWTSGSASTTPWSGQTSTRTRTTCAASSIAISRACRTAGRTRRGCASPFSIPAAATWSTGPRRTSRWRALSSCPCTSTGHRRVTGRGVLCPRATPCRGRGDLCC